MRGTPCTFSAKTGGRAQEKQRHEEVGPPLGASVTLFLQFTSALACSRAAMHPPPAAALVARCNAVQPSTSRACTSAPAASRASMAPWCPPTAALCRAVAPRSLATSGRAPAAKRAAMAGTRPRSAAWCSAVQPPSEAGAGKEEAGAGKEEAGAGKRRGSVSHLV